MAMSRNSSVNRTLFCKKKKLSSLSKRNLGQQKLKKIKSLSMITCSATKPLWSNRFWPMSWLSHLWAELVRHNLKLTFRQSKRCVLISWCRLSLNLLNLRSLTWSKSFRKCQATSASKCIKRSSRLISRLTKTKVKLEKSRIKQLVPSWWKRWSL